MYKDTESTSSTIAVTEVRELSKRFGSVTALDSLSFKVCRGEILGILGPNGAGKTTAIHCMLGLVTPTSGSIRILGLDVASHRQTTPAMVNTGVYHKIRH